MDLDDPNSIPHGEEIWRTYTPKIFRLIIRTTILTLHSVGNGREENLALFFFFFLSLEVEDN